ncbi:two-component system regulatory protein YycI [Rossellomorea arthrocnemi]|jgi:regulatory protein YycI of two-component signal transduction system YycFG|uniref:two-component system regulatory protein YycI n=1 Tax=Rossellomorea arthrocnemi TaxID=2769542 RepID=UPI00191AE5E6|nr:two-component system regulatory protein YycI [Rossellomorea arthrocnemi]
MDWSKTKSIFIIVFLVLDIFLLTIFMNKIRESNPATLEQTSFEETLKAANIKYPPKLSKEPVKDAIISASTKKISEKDLEKLDDQEVNAVNDNTINSTLKDPVSISDNFSPAELKEFIKENIVNGEQYSFWKYSKEDQTIVYFQTYQDRKIFNNANGKLILYLNTDKEIVSYKQTLLENLKESTGKKKLVTPFDALRFLVENNEIDNGSEITDIPNLGYSTFGPIDDYQVLAPTWHFIVEKDGKKEDLFINAVEAQIVEITKPEIET